MKAYEFLTKITPDGKLELPQHLKPLSSESEVRVIVLVEESEEDTFSADSFRTSWKQAIAGETLPLSELWEDSSVD